MLRVFLDANVYFAGCFSPRGASALILQLARHGTIQLVASRLVLREADRNLRRKGRPDNLRTFRRFLSTTQLHIVRPPSETAVAECEPWTHPKDAPILAAAISAKADYLVTLDRRHVLTEAVRSHVRGIKVVTPGEFLKIIL